MLALKPFERIALACKIVLGLICAWTITALFALGLQCSEPEPWSSSSGKCVDQYALYVTLAVLHMLLDIAVIALPSVLLWQIQIIQRRRFHIAGLFAVRLL